jgi:cytochrome P450/NADPH-cytochrome P450 reductase
MFDSMKDIASQLVLKWVRHGPSRRIAVAEDFTRLTLDTLALCAMGFRFNSFYSEKMHPFVDAMVHVLKYSEERATRPSIFRTFSRKDEKKWTQDIKYMRELSRDLLNERIQTSKESKDLLNAMITGKDQKTGARLTDDSTIDNMITFLVAGHETTSGALSFVFYFLLKHPEVLTRAQQEVDEIVGKEGVQYEHLSRMPYITAILRESLRLQPTAPAFSVTPKSDGGEVLAGKYHIEHGEAVHAILHNVHRDSLVYGDDSEDFDPARMLDESFNALPPCAWKPFGNGARGCIGTIWHLL